MRTAIPIITVMSLLLFAGMAIGGQVQLLDHDVQKIQAKEDAGVYSWEAEINNERMAPVKAEIKLAFVDPNGEVMATVQEPITLTPETKQAYTGKTTVNVDNANIETTKAELETHYLLGK